MNTVTLGHAKIGKLTVKEMKFALPAAGYLDIDADSVDTTAAQIIKLDVGVNSANCNVINATVDIGTLLSAGEIVKGCYFDMNEAVVNADTSSLIGYDVTITGFATARADLIGYRATLDGTKNGGDTSKGFIVVGTSTINNASEYLYGTHINLSGITQTEGVVYGEYIDVSAAVTAGSAYGSYYKLSAAATGIYIDAGTTDHTGAAIIDVNLDVNSAAINLINATIDIGTLLTAGEVVKGCYFDINEAVVNADTSVIVGYDATITGLATSRNDIVGYRITLDGTKNGGDSAKGLLVDGDQTINHASETVYGAHIDFSGMTQTEGVVYGEYIDVSQTITAGTAYGSYYKLSAAATGIHIDAGTIDHTAGNIIYADIDVNSASVNGISFDIDVGTALTAAETVNGISIDINGNAGDDAASIMNGIYLTSANTSTGVNTGISIAGTWDTGISMSGAVFTNDIVLQGGATVTNLASDDHVKVNVAVDTGTIRLNSKNYAANSGDIIGFQSKPAGNGDGTSTVYGAQISPRFNDGVAGASLVGIQVEPMLKGATAKALSGDVRALDIRLSDDGNAGHTVAGDTCGIKFYNLLKSSTFTGGVHAIVMTAAGDTQNWTSFAKFDDMAGIASVTNGTVLADISATINAGYIKVMIGAAVRYIPLYELKGA